MNAKRPRQFAPHAARGGRLSRGLSVGCILLCFSVLGGQQPGAKPGRLSPSSLQKNRSTAAPADNNLSPQVASLTSLADALHQRALRLQKEVNAGNRRVLSLQLLRDAREAEELAKQIKSAAKKAQ